MLNFLPSIASCLDNEHIPWKNILIGFSVAQFVFDSYVSYRQYRVLKDKTKKIPPILKGKIDEEKFAKSDEYGIAKSKFGFVDNLFSLVLNIVVLKYDLQPYIWNLSGKIGTKLISYFRPAISVSGLGIVTQSVFYFNLSTFAFSLLNLPFDYYSHFVLEEKFGFNKLTTKLWVTDLVKSNALQVVLMSPILYAVGKIFDKFTDNFIYYIMGFIAILQVLMILLVPTVILPLFNKFTPLEDGELKTKIEDLARKLKFPLDKIFVVDGSKRSSHSNAYFTGLPFFKQRIVIFDTLIEQSSVDEVVAVLGHEIGHWKKNHIIQLLLVGQFHISVIFTLFSAVYQNKSLYKSFGFNIESATGQKSVGKKVFLNNKFPYLIGFSIFGELLKPMDCLVQFIMNLFIRHNEYEADAFATKLGYGKELSQALITLQVANLSSMHVDPLYSSYHYNHPTLIERLDAIEAEIVKLEKKN